MPDNFPSQAKRRLEWATRAALSQHEGNETTHYSVGCKWSALVDDFRTFLLDAA